MRDIASLMNLAFKLTHEISEAALDFEKLPELRAHRFYANQVADAGVSTLAHVASASSSYSLDFISRMEATRSLAQARECLATLKRLLKTLAANGYIGADRAEGMQRKSDDITAVLMALTVELRGGSGIRRAS